jgi:hypothetical protein
MVDTIGRIESFFQNLIFETLRHHVLIFFLFFGLYLVAIFVARDYALVGNEIHQDVPTIIAEVATLTGLFLAIHQIRQSQEIYEVRDYRELLENLVELARSCAKNGGTIYFRCISPAVGFSRLCTSANGHDASQTVFGTLEEELRMLQANYRYQGYHFLRCARWSNETAQRIGIEDDKKELIDASEKKYGALKDALRGGRWKILDKEENFDALTPHFFILEQNGQLRGLVWEIGGHSHQNTKVDAIRTSSYHLLNMLKGSISSKTGNYL